MQSGRTLQVPPHRSFKKESPIAAGFFLEAICESSVAVATSTNYAGIKKYMD